MSKNLNTEGGRQSAVDTVVIQRKIEDLLESLPDGFYLTVTGFDDDEIAVLERTSPGIYEERLNIQSNKIFG